LNYLIDTNALSELKKRKPHPGVAHWFAERPAATLYLSVLTLGELRKGIEAMAEGERKQSYLDWLENDVPAYFSGRIIPIDTRIADCWGRLCASAGRTLPAIDSLLAATAMSHDLTMVTRNVIDFKLSSLRVINPWNEPLAG
jgi:predicted nucleic acid-binding protein